MNSYPGDQLLFTFYDLRRLFLRHRAQLKKIALLCAAGVFCLLLLQEPVYEFEATFKQSAKQSEIGPHMKEMKEMFQQFVAMGSDSGTVATMQSSAVVRGVVEELGMQVSCDKRFVAFAAARRIWRNVCAELGASLSDPDRFGFSNVVYSGERPLKMFIQLLDVGTYQLFDQHKQLVGQGKLGEAVGFSSGHLTLSHIPAYAKVNHFYSLVVSPWEKTVRSLKKRLTIAPLKLDKTILKLTFTSADRFLGAEFLNRLMGGYQTYLKQENDALCEKQIAHLQKRQDELMDYYGKALVEHAAYLKENLVKNGFIGFDQEIETLSAPKNFYTSKLFDVDLDLKRLHVLHPPKQGEGEFAGLNLATAQSTLVEYTKQRDGVQAQVMEISFLKEQITKPDFEMSSLGGVFEDSVIRELINKSSAIVLQLKDENNRSAREQERLQEALQTHKHFLSHYLLQTGEMKKLRLKLLDDKIASLQQTTLTLLESEKALLKVKLQELNTKMGDLPEKWSRESLLTLQKELGATMLEGVAQLVEAKNLSQQIFQISSKPLDLAFSPLKPKAPNLLLTALLTALGATFGSYFLILCRALYKGLPVSDAILKLSGFPVSGKLSSYCNTPLAQIQQQDLETLRRCASVILSGPREARVAVCIGGQYPDYSQALAELLAMQGARVLLIQCTLDKIVPSQQIPGFMQYLRQEVLDLPLQREATYDLLFSGGTSRHAAEILCGAQFQSLLSQVKEQYDVILLYSSCDAAKAEGSALLKLADRALVTVQQEKKEELEVYLSWAAQSTTFIYAPEGG